MAGVLLGCVAFLVLTPAALAASGSISGTVTEAGSKTPLGGIEVMVYSEGPPSYKLAVASSKTEAATGNYTVGGLPAGSYRVEFSDPLQKYAPLYYEDARELYTAERVVVEEGKTTGGINGVLREGGTISGTVTGGPSNEPLANVDVFTLPAISAEGCRLHAILGGCNPRFVVTDAEGKYVLSGLPENSYQIEFSPPIGLNLVSQFVDETIEEEKKYEINAKLKVGGEISGTVTDAPTHAPLAGVSVVAETGGPGVEPIIRTATTNANGEYTIVGLPTGSYYVNFARGGYISQYAAAVAVTQGITTSGVNVAFIREEPVNTSPPVLSGTPAVGHALSCGTGTWTGLTEVFPPRSRFTYRWLRDGGAIGYRPASTYVVRPSDRGRGLACQVIAANLVSEGVTATSNTLNVPPAPTIKNVSQSNFRWREGNKLATYSRKRKPPIGTTFEFVLNQQAVVSFAFTQRVGGRKVGGKCVAKTKANRREPSCKRTVTHGTLTFTGHARLNKVAFQGRISGSKRLPLGAYALRITAVNLAGRSSVPSLSFMIIK